MSGYDPEKHHRRSIRLSGYDYAGAGAYFVTVCTRGKESLFGAFVGDQVRLSPWGRIALQCWRSIPQHYARVGLGAFVVMPNHVHGIIHIEEAGTACRAPTTEAFARPVAGSLATIVRSFKAAVTRRVRRLDSDAGRRIWQRGYFEHVVRNGRDFDRIGDYILTNPERWLLDRENPSRQGEDEFDRWIEAFKKRPDGQEPKKPGRAGT